MVGFQERNEKEITVFRVLDFIKVESQGWMQENEKRNSKQNSSSMEQHLYQFLIADIREETFLKMRPVFQTELDGIGLLLFRHIVGIQSQNMVLLHLLHFTILT